MPASKLYFHYDGRLGPSMTWIHRICDETAEEVSLDMILKTFVTAYNEKHHAEPGLESAALGLQNEHGATMDKNTMICHLKEKNGIDDIEVVDLPMIEPKKTVEEEVDYGPMLSRALKHREAKKNLAAVQVLRDMILSTHVSHARAWCVLSDIDYDNQKYTQALEKLNQARATCKRDTYHILWRRIKCWSEDPQTLHQAIESIETLLVGYCSTDNPESSNSRDTLVLPTKTELQTYYGKLLYHAPALALAKLKVTPIQAQDQAIHLWTNVIQHSPDHPTALGHYAKAALDRGKHKDAMQMILNLLVAHSTDRPLRTQFIECLDVAGLDTITGLLVPNQTSAPAYAFLASLTKEGGAIDASVALFQLSVTHAPGNVSYVLNLVHMYEIVREYDTALGVIQEFYAQYPDGAVAGVRGIIMNELMTTNGRTNAKVVIQWHPGFPSYAQVQEADVQKIENIIDGTSDGLSDKLDCLALSCTLVKILFLIGNLEWIPALIQNIESTRRQFKDLHLTSIRNEVAYYTCIAQLLSIPGIHPATTDACPMYICGDSHTLSTAWRQVSIHGSTRLLVPVLVTGLKHWHLRHETNFYPKKEFYNAMHEIPNGAQVVFLFGEIDCREGILLAIEKCKYKDLSEGIHHTIGIFMAALEKIVHEKQLKAFIHPIVPVLNETRFIVQQYNLAFKKQVLQRPKIAKWLDFYQDLVTADGSQLKKTLELDGTHLHPSYLAFFEKALASQLKKC